MVGTPAYAAGVLPGDLILEIDGQSTDGMSPDRAVEVLTGRVGTPVKIQVKHEADGKVELLSMTRAVIDMPSVLGDVRKADDSWEYMIDPDRKIGYIRITSFIQNTTEELKVALNDLKGEGMKALILDLRDNPGGLLSAAVEVSDLFLDGGVIVSTKGRNTPSKVYEAQKDGQFTDFPMVVLVNHSSASAAEIVLGLSPGPQARQDCRPAELRQGLGAEHPGTGRRQQRAEVDRRLVPPAFGQEHSSVQERQG